MKNDPKATHVLYRARVRCGSDRSANDERTILQKAMWAKNRKQKTAHLTELAAATACAVVIFRSPTTERDCDEGARSVSGSAKEDQEPRLNPDEAVKLSIARALRET